MMLGGPFSLPTGAINRRVKGLVNTAAEQNEAQSQVP
jgi:hypothetical protein